MRVLAGVLVCLALGACSGATETSKPPSKPAAEPGASTATAGLPEGFPQADLAERGPSCIVYLGLSMHAKATPSGRDAPIMQQASDQWRASLEIDGKMTEAEVNQLVGSSVNALTATPAEQRDAASEWCVENAPEPDPAR